MSKYYQLSFARRANYLKEQQRLTQFSPRIFCKGPHIRNFEEITRIVFYPDHLNPDGSFRVESISREDLTKKGFSVFRKSHTERAAIDNVEALYKIKNPAREAVGALINTAEKLRAISDDTGFSSIYIIDDSPTPILRGHALILCSEPSLKKSRVKELRGKIAETLKPQDLDITYPPAT